MTISKYIQLLCPDASDISLKHHLFPDQQSIYLWINSNSEYILYNTANLVVIVKQQFEQSQLEYMQRHCGTKINTAMSMQYSSDPVDLHRLSQHLPLTLAEVLMTWTFAYFISQMLLHLENTSNSAGTFKSISEFSCSIVKYVEFLQWHSGWSRMT